jgi:hypothetical protein
VNLLSSRALATAFVCDRLLCGGGALSRIDVMMTMKSLFILFVTNGEETKSSYTCGEQPSSRFIRYYKNHPLLQTTSQTTKKTAELECKRTKYTDGSKQPHS